MMKSNYEGRGDGWSQANIHKGRSFGGRALSAGGGGVREKEIEYRTTII